MDSWQFEAIGTSWHLQSPDPLNRDAVIALVEEFDRVWSRFRADSVVSALRKAGTVDLGPDAPPILDLYDRLYTLTDGAVSPAIGASLEQLGYDAEYTLTAQGAAIPAFCWPLARREGTRLTVDEPVVLDIGAVGKGYLAQQVAQTAGEAVTVDAGGDIVHHGRAELRVAMEHPLDPQRAVGVIDLPPGLSVCASSPNRRRWASDLHHVLDARTGRPTRQVVASWSVGPDAAVADGLATALFFVEPEVVLDAFPEFGCAALDTDMRLRGGRIVGEVF